MDTEILKRSKEINTEIEKPKTAINNISYHHKHAKNNMPNKRYDWLLRVFNRKKDD
jgi:hypothetical protein